MGYCQGLPFCVGLLLMHAEEKAAFSLLKSLMFSVGLRYILTIESILN